MYSRIITCCSFSDAFEQRVFWMHAIFAWICDWILGPVPRMNWAPCQSCLEIGVWVKGWSASGVGFFDYELLTLIALSVIHAHHTCTPAVGRIFYFDTVPHHDTCCPTALRCVVRTLHSTPNMVCKWWAPMWYTAVCHVTVVTPGEWPCLYAWTCPNPAIRTPPG